MNLFVYGKRKATMKKLVGKKDDLRSLQVTVWRYSYPASHQPFSFITFRKENDDNQWHSGRIWNILADHNRVLVCLANQNLKYQFCSREGGSRPDFFTRIVYTVWIHFASFNRANRVGGFCKFWFWSQQWTKQRGFLPTMYVFFEKCALFCISGYYQANCNVKKPRAFLGRVISK